MKALDRLLQRWRIRQAAQFIPRGSRVLDIGCADGALFRLLGDHIVEGIGIDPAVVPGSAGSRGRIYRGLFPAALPDDRSFDVVCLLAVLEHVSEQEQRALAKECSIRLAPRGVIVATVPSPSVDRILALLRRARLIDGMALEEHYGFKPADLPDRFVDQDLRLLHHSRFQLGLNHLYVFERAR